MWALLLCAVTAWAAEFNSSVLLEVDGFSPMMNQGSDGYRFNSTTGLLDKHAFDNDTTFQTTFVGTAFTLVGSLYRPRWDTDNNQPLATTSSTTSNATSNTLQNSLSTEGTIVSLSDLELTFHNFTTVVGASTNSTFRALRFEVPVLTQS